MAGSSDSSRLLHAAGSASYGSFANDNMLQSNDNSNTRRESRECACDSSRAQRFNTSRPSDTKQPCRKYPRINNDNSIIDLEMNTAPEKHSLASSTWCTSLVTPSSPPGASYNTTSTLTTTLSSTLTTLIPGLSWLRMYSRTSILPDLMGALTVASLYIPLAFSFASVASVPPASSLYAFVFHPPIYALLGTCPLMVIGPEATGSLLVGAAIHSLSATAGSGQSDAATNALIAGAATALAGLILLAMGFLRLGFLDNVLSRPLMKGFICGVGVVLVIKQAVPGLGLQLIVEEAAATAASLASEGGGDSGGQGSALGTLMTLLGSFGQVDLLAAAFSVSTLGFVLVCAHIKKRCAKQYPAIVYLPDRFIAIVISAFVVWLLGLDESSDLEIVGAVGSSSPGLPSFNAGLFTDFTRLRAVSNTALMIALLGYFESSVTGKSMRRPSASPTADDPSDDTATRSPTQTTASGSQPQLQQQQLQHSADGELIALGTANLLGGHFSTLPAFGGFGRSKLNLQAGSQSPMSGIFLALISLLSILYITPCLYYVPRATLAAMSCAVGIAMVEECCHDLVFFLKARAWREVVLMGVVAGVIFGKGMEEGVVVGMGLTLVVLVKGASGVRVEVSSSESGCGEDKEDYKGKTPLSSPFSSSSSSSPRPEHNGCLDFGTSPRRRAERRGRMVTLIVRDSLTFVNSGALITQVDQAVESAKETGSAIVLDISDISAIDACSAQLVVEALQRHVSSGVRVFVCEPESSSALRVLKRAGILEISGDGVRIVTDLLEAWDLLQEPRSLGLL